MITFSSNYIGDFKVGDNIAFNLEILQELYKFQKSMDEDRKELLCKPIIIEIASIAEALLFDLYLRINNFTREGVPNISEEVLAEIRTKTIDQFAKYISHAKSKTLLGGDSTIYDALHFLRKLRNSIHIQNINNDFERDENIVFSEKRQIESERILENLMAIMVKNYTRSNKQAHGFVRKFTLPWNSHLQKT